MGKKETINNSVKNVVKDTAIAAAGFIPSMPVALVTVACISSLCEIGTVITDYYRNKKNKQANEEKIIEKLKQLEPIRECDSGQKDSYIAMLGKVFSNITLKEDTSIGVRELLPEIKTIVENEYPNTTEKNYEILSQLVYYEIAWLTLEDNPEKLTGYVLSENLDRKNEVDILNEEVDNVKKDVSAIKNDVEVLKDNVDVLSGGIRTEIEESKISGIIKEYADKYTETLYLHKDTEWDVEDTEKRVSLRNLYVEPEIKRSYGGKGHVYSDMSTIFSSGDDKFVIFLGDAGTGKTSWVQKLAYLYTSADENNGEATFNGKELIIVKLRELDRNEISINGLYKAISKYLKVKDDESVSWFENKYLVLDGMDEIYSGISNPNYGELLQQIADLSETACKVILTSRPGILQGQKNDYTVYTICPYDKRKKEEWIKKYEKVIGTKINEEIRKTIFEDTDKTIFEDTDKTFFEDTYNINTVRGVFHGKQKETSIFDYPQLLYMIAGSKPSDNWSIDNKWSIYRHILYEESYIQHSEISTKKRKSYRKIRDKIYSILKNIAYDMYKKGSSTKINVNTIDEITREEINIEEIRKFAYRFGCYWGITEDNSEVEFYHNNIRDFFIAEYISFKLDELFEKSIDMIAYEKTDSINKYEIVQNEIYMILRSVPIHKEVFEFMSLKIKFYKEKNDNDKIGAFYKFLKKNYLVKRDEENQAGINDALTRFMDELFSNLNIYSNLSEENGASSVERIGCFLNNYLSIVCSLLDNESSNYKLRNEFALGHGSYLKSTYVYRDFGRYISLNKASLTRADLRGAALSGADLIGADLRGADLRGAALSGADLREAVLIGADLIGADLIGADLRGAALIGADLRGANLFGAALTRAALSEANLFGAGLRDAVLREANLRETDLREADLKGANLREADLREADLKEADLREADLREADLKGADFKYAKYTMEEVKWAQNWEFAKNIKNKTSFKKGKSI